MLVVRFEMKIQSLGITVRHHSASLVMPNIYPRDGIFNQHLTTIKDSCSLVLTGYENLTKQRTHPAGLELQSKGGGGGGGYSDFCLLQGLGRNPDFKPPKIPTNFGIPQKYLPISSYQIKNPFKRKTCPVLEVKLPSIVC